MSNISSDLAQRIRAVFRGEIDADGPAVDEASADASVFEIRPEIVVSPAGVDDVKAMVRLASSGDVPGLSLTARSAGTDMSGGALTSSVVVRFTPHLNAIREIGDGYATTQPGAFYRDFEKATLAKGWLLPCYPASRELCTVGGMAANNSGGEKSLRYGKTDQFVTGLKVVLRDGEEYVFGPLTKTELDEKMALDSFEGDLYRKSYRLLEDNHDAIQKARPNVSKNSAGYALWNVWDRKTFDLTKLFVGSQGTLGLITEITYRLVRPETHSKLVVIFLKDLNKLPDLVNAVLAHQPESFESYDDHTLKFAMRYFRDIMAALGTKSMFSLARQFLPEVGMVLTSGFPKLVMLAEFTGSSPKEVDRKISGVVAGLEPFGLPVRVTKTEREAHKYWVIRRESFSLLRKHFKKAHTAPFIDDFCVRPEHLPKFLPELYAILAEYHLTLTIVGHVGDGNFHIIPIMDFHRPDMAQIVRDLSKRTYELVFRYGGTTTGEHNDGLIRSSFLRQMYGDEIYALFEETKRIFDPEGIFNPGKKVGTDIEEALTHLKRA